MEAKKQIKHWETNKDRSKERRMEAKKEIKHWERNKDGSKETNKALRNK